MITTVIFDLDGLLSDTERLHMGAYKTVFSNLGVPISSEQYEEHWIRDGKGIAAYIKENKLEVDEQLVRSEKAKEYERLVYAEAEPMPGAMELLNTLPGKKRVALATSSYDYAAGAVIKKLGIEHFFECITTKVDVKKVKPFPDLFLRTADVLGVEPAECVVFEDAEKGVVAAHTADMKCIAVPNVYTKDNDFSKATLVLESLEDVTLELIDKL